MAIPIMADQPLVANRICNELNFGKKLDFRTFTSDELRALIYQVLADKTYHANVYEFTQLSRKKNGCVNAANLIENYLNKIH